MWRWIVIFHMVIGHSAWPMLTDDPRVVFRSEGACLKVAVAREAKARRAGNDNGWVDCLKFRER